MKKMYIAVLDEAPDYMVPTLVAHSVMNAHDFFKSPGRSDAQRAWYSDWNINSFRKVVVKVPGTVFDKIHATLDCWAGHENTICNGATTCLVVNPVESDDVPKPLQYAQLWKPAQPAHITDDWIAENLPAHISMMLDSVPIGLDASMRSTIHRYAELISAIRIGYYRVCEGDTLSHIGMYTGADWRELARINNLKNPDLIYPGQLIKLR